MAHYVSTIAHIDDGVPVFDSMSELDGKIIAWDEKIFSSLLSVGQSGRQVFVASEPEDLGTVASQVMTVGPSVCLMERRFFESHFKQKTQMKGENFTDG